jgi:hypothetical protein
VLSAIQGSGPSQLHAAALSSLEASHSAIPDEIGLQLGKGRAQPKQSLSRRRAGVDSFAEAYQLHIEFSQFLPKARHMREGAGQAIKAHNNDRRHLLASRRTKHLVEGWAATFSATHPVVHVLDSLYAAPLGVGAEFGELCLRVLVISADTSIEGDGRHERSSQVFH